MPFEYPTMNPSERINAFVKLGIALQNLSSDEKEELTWRAGNDNSWFTPQAIDAALQGIISMLEPEKFISWATSYDLQEVANPKSIGILMAGNIPGVGFHDFMCVLLSGHRAVAKLSSTDTIFMKFMIHKLCEVESRFKALIEVKDMLNGMHAYIATGSDNSSRYFNYYFGKYPHVIRQNRTSVAVLSGEESTEDYVNLGKDIFHYFGLGCRNISKVFIKSEEQLQPLLNALEVYSEVGNHHKYRNNYDYNKSILLVNGEPHLDNGFLLLQKSTELLSPISVLFYEIYEDSTTLMEKLEPLENKIQCVVAREGLLKDTVSFGAAQSPQVDDFADGVDTMKFLLSL